MLINFDLLIKELQDENDRLQKDIQLAQTELKEATDAMNTMADDYAKLKVSFYAYVFSTFCKQSLNGNSHF